MTLESKGDVGHFSIDAGTRTFRKQLPYCDALIGPGDIETVIAVSALVKNYTIQHQFRYPWTIPLIQAATFDGFAGRYDFTEVEHGNDSVRALPNWPEVVVSILGDIHLMTSSLQGPLTMDFLIEGARGEPRNPLYCPSYWADLTGEGTEVFTPLLSGGKGEEQFNDYLSKVRAKARQSKEVINSLGVVIAHGDFQTKNIWLASPDIVVGDWDGVRVSLAWAEIFWLAMAESYQLKDGIVSFDSVTAQSIIKQAMVEMEVRPALKVYWQPIPSFKVALLLWEINCLRAAYTSYLRATALENLTVTGVDSKNQNAGSGWKLFGLNLRIIEFLEREGMQFFEKLYR